MPFNTSPRAEESAGHCHPEGPRALSYNSRGSALRVLRGVLTAFHGDEQAFVTVFIAVMGSALIMVLGLAVEGGRVLIQYRAMQEAADMAALVGAQKLPCRISSSTCVVSAESLACTYVADNGFSGCTAGGGSGAMNSADVPPVSCSPYDIVDYGNDNYGGAGNPSCKRAVSQPTSYNYIEVRLQDKVAIPIFNVKVNLYAHAVARSGKTTPLDFAVATLDPANSQALLAYGNANTVIVGSAMSNGGIDINGNANSEEACAGGWYANGSIASGVTSANANGTSSTVGPGFAPPSCITSSGSAAPTDNPAETYTGMPQIPDPYAYSTPPTGNMSTNCAPCAQTAYYYDRTAGTWYQATGSVSISGNHTYEMFPGVYNGAISISGGTIYFNPGVYTIQGSLTINGNADMCVFGAPICDQIPGANLPGTSASCSTASFQSGSSSYVDPGKWYYYCSPWGIWDTQANGEPSSLQDNTPVFLTQSGTPSSRPLNGVTFFMQGSVTINGNSTAYIADPNPCPGTGEMGSDSVTFTAWPMGEPSGASGGYTYSTGSVARQEGYTTSNDDPPANASNMVYPDANFLASGECNNGYSTWLGEFNTTSSGGNSANTHLQFLFFADGASCNSISMSGNTYQLWWGSIHNFPQNYTGSPGPPTTSYSSCSVTFSGNSQVNNGPGGSQLTGGPPSLEGQIVSDTAGLGGSSTIEIFYRQSGTMLGAGSSLVE